MWYFSKNCLLGVIESDLEKSKERKQRDQTVTESVVALKKIYLNIDSWGSKKSSIIGSTSTPVESKATLKQTALRGPIPSHALTTKVTTERKTAL